MSNTFGLPNWLLSPVPVIFNHSSPYEIPLNKLRLIPFVPPYHGGDGITAAFFCSDRFGPVPRVHQGE